MHVSVLPGACPPVPGSFPKASIMVVRSHSAMCFGEKPSCFAKLVSCICSFKVLHDTALVQELDVWHKVGKDKGRAISLRRLQPDFLSL